MLRRLRRLLRALGRDAVVLWYACRHPAAPRLLKLGTALLALYVLSPVDLIPDWFVLLGWVDDASVVAFGIPALLKLAPAETLRDARAAAEGLLSRRRLW